jgi:predicted ATPase/transcriptional regulator with GAF, ATPase, and Fis domain
MSDFVKELWLQQLEEALSTGATEPVRKDEEFVLYRAHATSHGDAPSLLLLTPAGSRPTVQTLSKIEHEYSLRSELSSAWAVRPVALSEYRGQPTLILEDPGGEILEGRLTQPMEIAPFLRLAAGLATALARVHESGLIHKDIKPGNILVNPTTGDVRLLGFAIASRLPRECQPPEPPGFIAGTLPYMAPEQTGRMNRSIDSRSDLYSLGVTLYQMLTGILPFTASDPLEWVHCHIARQPVPPSDRLHNVPASVSEIIVKLLAKTAEKRYQTAAGVACDLQRCLAEWEAQRHIDKFELGQRDAPDRLMIPEKLYGRECEVETLLAAFRRVVAGSAPELVLVSGYSGIGKSSVVNELYKVLVPPRGLFASGKFDQHKRDIPYSTLAQAFQSLVRRLLAKSEAELAPWRDALCEALGPNARLMVDLVPELKLITGEPRPIPELPPQDSQRRFQLVFRRFIGVFARPEHPLALFLDDLQWLDTATLDVLEDLLTQEDVQHLLLIGAYRDNEVDAAHPLTLKLMEIRHRGGAVREIVLTPLSREDLGQLIADSLHCEPTRALPLAQLVHEKTGGNPFFTIQFITALNEDRLVTFDYREGRWTWDLNRIHARAYTDNVVDLLVVKLNHLSVETRKALQMLACLGNSAKISLLKMICNGSHDVHGDLREAVRDGLVFCFEDSYRFLHDRVQEAAYSLIPVESRAEAHLRIGRLVVAKTPPEEREEKIFEIVNHLNRAAALITSPDERAQLAELNLLAGKRAKASTAYASALNYLIAGSATLPDNSWERRPDIAFELELHRAECEFLSGHLSAAEERLSALSCRARNTVELAAVAALQVNVYTTLDQNDRAVVIGLEYLRHLGVEWLPNPTEREVEEEYARIWSQVGTRQIEDLIDLPLMTNPDVLDALDVLADFLTAALFSNENLSSLVICRMVNLSLEHGNSDGSCFAYVWLAIIAGQRFGNYKDGFRFGRLGYDLVERRGLKRFQARTYQGFGNIVLPWTRHVRTGRELIRRAFNAANTIGDVTYAGICCDHMLRNMLLAGDQLVDVQKEAESGLQYAQKVRFGRIVDHIKPQLGLIRALRGLTQEVGSLTDDQFDELRFESYLASNPSMAEPECWYWVRKLQARVFARDYAAAVDASLSAQRRIGTSPSQFMVLDPLETAEYHFYSALAHAAAWDAVPQDQRQRHLDTLVGHYRRLEQCAENGPENFENRAILLSAEIARIEGRDFEAMHLYKRAIHSAHANGFIQVEALAYELAGQFYGARGFDEFADAYLRQAKYGYLRWGADAKVKQLDQLYPNLRAEVQLSDSPSTIVAPVELLDLKTVIKVSQTVSSEMVLEKLIEKLMCTAIEHAGAGRGLLILLQGDELRVEAEARTEGDAVTVHLPRASIAPDVMPGSMLHYVARTQEGVILEDASAQNQFSGDTYIVQHQAGSILCLPLINQAKLIGILYLENHLTPRVFTPSRIAALKVLASQAAISLENTRLYRDLEQRFIEQKRAEAEIRALKDQLYRENLALRDEVDRASMFEEIVGNSKPLQAVLSRIAKVAPTDSTVFITGETGTGKELIARALHKRSQRFGRAFVSVNCAALAPSLISSELFGHEKGAFTGAMQRRLGRFELADSGTIFLDEVGELPPDTQVALLRVLQEREFERVGGAQSIHVDVRVIAATNRDLKAAVASGSFRQDLFYRLNVFPIEVPPLRDREEDILLLIEYFVKRYASRTGKNIRSIDKKTLDLLQSYHWPGNIRELQNVIERSVILTPGEVLSVDELWFGGENVRPAGRVDVVAPSRNKENESVDERIIVEQALAESRGRVSGPSGAAAKLGVPPSTLDRRIKALKINKIQFKFRRSG